MIFWRSAPLQRGVQLLSLHWVDPRLVFREETEQTSVDETIDLGFLNSLWIPDISVNAMKSVKRLEMFKSSAGIKRGNGINALEHFKGHNANLTTSSI